MTDYAAYFIAGATYFLIWSKGISLARIGIIVLSFGLALFKAINRLQDFEKHYNTSMNSFVVTGIITTFFFVMLLVSLRRTSFFGRNQWLLAGTLTYPLYLLHQNIGFMVFNIAYPTVNSHLLFWSTIIVVIGAAYAVHILVEKRISLPMKKVINNLLDVVTTLSGVESSRLITNHKPKIKH
jgi:peptidoglycan/LPS O-acetylase OafA/YrhL